MFSPLRRFSITAIALLALLGTSLGLAVGTGETANSLATLWSKQPAGSPFATVDSHGNVLTAETASPAGIVLTKYDPNGNLVWSGSLADTDAVRAIATDGSGNVVVASASAVTSVSPNGLVTNFTVTPSAPVLSIAVDPSGNVIVAENEWDEDLIIAKYDAGGAQLFSKVVSSTGGIEDLSLATDTAGNIVVAAAYQFGAIDFGGGTLTAPYLDSMVLAKLTSAGQHVFSKVFNPPVAADGTYAGVYTMKVACDGKNNIVTAGTLSGMGKFVLGNKSVTLPSPGETTMLLAKFSPTGAISFVKSIGTDGLYVEALAVDAAGNILTTGENWGSPLFGGVDGVFVAKFNGNGTLRAGRIIGSTSGTAHSIAADHATGSPVVGGSDFPANYVLKLRP